MYGKTNRPRDIVCVGLVTGALIVSGCRQSAPTAAPLDFTAASFCPSTREFKLAVGLHSDQSKLWPKLLRAAGHGGDLETPPQERGA